MFQEKNCDETEVAKTKNLIKRSLDENCDVNNLNEETNKRKKKKKDKKKNIEKEENI